jgi:hypothetical protein
MAFNGFQFEIAGSREQQVPGREDLARRGDSMDVPTTFPQPQPPTDPVVKRLDPATSEGGQASPPPPPRLDRFAELVSAESTILRQFRPGVLTAVVRPDPQSELRIELRLHRGQVEARASLERGDSEAFAAGWPELQASLLGQGIQLLPLGESMARSTDGAAGTGGTGGDSRQGRSGPDSDLHSDKRAFGVFSDVLKPSKGPLASKASAATGGTRHLLESWA